LTLILRIRTVIRAGHDTGDAHYPKQEIIMSKLIDLGSVAKETKGIYVNNVRIDDNVPPEFKCKPEGIDTSY